MPRVQVNDLAKPIGLFVGSGDPCGCAHWRQVRVRWHFDRIGRSLAIVRSRSAGSCFRLVDNTGSNAASARSIGGEDSTRENTIALSGSLDPHATVSECLPLADGTLVLGGRLTATDFVQCREDVPPGVALTYTFNLPPLPSGSIVKGVRGLFGLDEGVTWIKRGRTPCGPSPTRGRHCEVQARWQRPAECRSVSSTGISGGQLIITQRVFNANLREHRPLYAGIVGLALRTSNLTK